MIATITAIRDNDHHDQKVNPEIAVTLGPANCPCIDVHYGATVIERTYPVAVDVLFELLYAEAAPPAVPQSALFTEQFLRSRGTTDLKMTPWRPLGTPGELGELAKTCKDLGIYGDLRRLFARENGENSIKNRNLEYTFELNHVLCKSCYTRERQFLLAQKAGSYYVVLSEAKNEGPPFSDSFVVCSTMCLTSAGSGQAKLAVQYKLCWIKSSFSMRMLTGTIERSSKEGFTDIANDKLRRMEMHLKLIPADEHFLTTLAACSPEMAAVFAAGGSAVTSGLASPQATSSGGAAVVLNSGGTAAAGFSQTADLSPQISAPTSSLLHSSEMITGTSRSSSQQSSVANPMATPNVAQTGNSATSRFGLLANVNLLLVILLLFTVAYIVLINRVWAMEARLDKMAEYILTLLEENEDGADAQGGAAAGSPSTRLEL